MSAPNPVMVGNVQIGRNRPLALIAGPCVMEPGEMTLPDRAIGWSEICRRAGRPTDLQGFVRQGESDLRVEFSRSGSGGGNEGLCAGQGRDGTAGDHRYP